MSKKARGLVLAGLTLALASWAWGQQGGPGQSPVGPQGQAGIGPGTMAHPGNVPLRRRYTSNGERIYYTGISARTGPIPTTGGPMWMRGGA